MSDYDRDGKGEAEQQEAADYARKQRELAAQRRAEKSKKE